MLIYHVYARFDETSVQIFRLFFNPVVCFLTVEFWEFFRDSEYRLLSNKWFANIFCSLYLIFSFSEQSIFHRAEVFNFDGV